MRSSRNKAIDAANSRLWKSERNKITIPKIEEVKPRPEPLEGYHMRFSVELGFKSGVVGLYPKE